MRLSLLKPLSAMLASFVMCMTFVISFSTEAFEVSELKHYIKIINSDDIEKTKFIVNDKAFSWKDLSEAQQHRYFISRSGRETIKEVWGNISCKL
ncbi:hypothetical protein [Aliikangiella sp. IMCC44359]|uniref:hypothetical protein n=1 Tax=Aliikangiella sp. IMCC44359 TaxID=3459125 RepID=UPI00403B15D1